MKAIKSPIPTDIALFILRGILLTIASLTLKAVRIINIIPSIKTAVKAVCQLCPIPITTVYAKNAFNPIPGANAKGRFAKSAITKVAIKEDITVAVNTAPLSIPVAPSISGLTANI